MGLPGLTFVGFVTVLPVATGLTAPRDRSDRSTQEALQRAASSCRTFECVRVLILKDVNTKLTLSVSGSEICIFFSATPPATLSLNHHAIVKAVCLSNFPLAVNEQALQFLIVYYGGHTG